MEDQRSRLTKEDLELLRMFKVKPHQIIKALERLMGFNFPLENKDSVEDALHYMESLAGVKFPFDMLEDDVVICYTVSKTLSQFYDMLLFQRGKKHFVNTLEGFVKSYDPSTYIICYDTTYGKDNSVFVITGNEVSPELYELDNDNTIVVTANLPDFGLVNLITMKSYIKREE